MENSEKEEQNPQQEDQEKSQEEEAQAESQEEESQSGVESESQEPEAESSLDEKITVKGVSIKYGLYLGIILAIYSLALQVK